MESVASEMITAISSARRATIFTEFFIAVIDEMHQLQERRKKGIRVRKCELGTTDLTSYLDQIKCTTKWLLIRV
jgi:hypothetical protein